MNIVTNITELRKRSIDVVADDDVSSLVDDMAVTMYVDNGIGLAAPQVGVFKRIIVMDPYNEGTVRSLKIMINPVITFESDAKVHANEGCLSLPGQQILVKRSHTIKVKYRSLTSDTTEEELTGLPARVVQHEIDHLNGVLMIDRGTQLP